jgi:hypothetical protein
MFPNVCRCIATCCVYFEVRVLCRKDLRCSLYLVLKSWPVCPMYALPQSGHVNLEIPEHVNMSFTYTGKETTFITKLFTHTNVKIAYRTNNNLIHHLTPSPHPHDIFTC